MVLKCIGKYLSLMESLAPVAADAFDGVAELFDFYLYAVFTLFSVNTQRLLTLNPARCVFCTSVFQRLLLFHHQSRVLSARHFLFPSRFLRSQRRWRCVGRRSAHALCGRRGCLFCLVVVVQGQGRVVDECALGSHVVVCRPSRRQARRAQECWRRARRRWWRWRRWRPRRARRTRVGGARRAQGDPDCDQGRYRSVRLAFQCAELCVCVADYPRQCVRVELCP